MHTVPVTESFWISEYRSPHCLAPLQGLPPATVSVAPAYASRRRVPEYAGYYTWPPHTSHHAQPPSCVVFSQQLPSPNGNVIDRQTDRQTDKQTDKREKAKQDKTDGEPNPESPLNARVITFPWYSEPPNTIAAQRTRMVKIWIIITIHQSFKSFLRTSARLPITCMQPLCRDCISCMHT